MADGQTQPPLNYNEYVVYKLGAIESKIDELKAAGIINDGRTTAVEDRVSKLENNKYWITGAASGIATVVSLALKFLYGSHGA